MKRIETKAYGAMDIDERQILRFPDGILGFEERHDWALLDSTQAPFLWLQSLDQASLAFVLLNPDFFRPDYRVELSEVDRLKLEQPADADLLVFAIVTIPEKQDRMSANLQGPVVINRKAGIGRQTIQSSQQWKVRHYILDELAATGAQ